MRRVISLALTFVLSLRKRKFSRQSFELLGFAAPMKTRREEASCAPKSLATQGTQAYINARRRGAKRVGTEVAKRGGL
jgi:hypothetical protein